MSTPRDKNHQHRGDTNKLKQTQPKQLKLRRLLLQQIIPDAKIATAQIVRLS